MATQAPRPELVEFVTRFNRGDYEASLEAIMPLWGQAQDKAFYKGLIQLVGAFQHWNSGNAFWAEDLFATAHNLLEPYAPSHAGLDVEALLAEVRRCNERARLAKESGSSALTQDEMPRIHLNLTR